MAIRSNRVRTIRINKNVGCGHSKKFLLAAENRFKDNFVRKITVLSDGKVVITMAKKAVKKVAKKKMKKVC